KRNVPVPGSKGSDLILVKAGFLFGVLEAHLNGPSDSCCTDHLREVCLCRSADDMGFEFVRFMGAPPYQKPSLPAFNLGRIDPKEEPVIQPWPFRSIPGAHPHPTIL